MNGGSFFHMVLAPERVSHPLRVFCGKGGMARLRLTVAALLAAALLPAVLAQSAPTPPAVVAEFTNPGLSPSHWTLTLHRDGSGHFRSERGDAQSSGPQQIDAPSMDRDIQVSHEFADRVFQAAQQHRWFNQECESHLKVAFQGSKRLSYTGPEGQGACTFNYSKDKEIQELGDEFVAVAETLLAGARLELLLQHDRLGLDQEMESLVEGVKDGRMREVCAIKDILEKLQDDPSVLDRVRKRARVLLARTET